MSRIRGAIILFSAHIQLTEVPGIGQHLLGLCYNDCECPRIPQEKLEEVPEETNRVFSITIQDYLNRIHADTDPPQFTDGEGVLNWKYEQHWWHKE